VIISRELARHVASAGHAALGSRIRLGGDKWSKVIGVSADARYRDVTKAGVDIFVPYLQAQGVPTNYLVLRGTQQANDLNALVRRSLAEMDPAQAISGEATLGDLIDRNTARHRFNVTLLIWFAICAAVLVAGAVYSVVAETVAARRQELSIRVALGSGRTRLILQFVSGTVGIVLAGELLGIFFTATIGSIWAGLLYGVSPRDPAVFGSVSVFVFGVSLAAGLFPVLAATRQSVQALLRTN
jgi:putative ABC transport system permease protein